MTPPLWSGTMHGGNELWAVANEKSAKRVPRAIESYEGMSSEPLGSTS